MPNKTTQDSNATADVKTAARDMTEGARKAAASMSDAARDAAFFGDARGNSVDGRFFGLVRADDLYGRAVAVYYRRGEGLGWIGL